MIYDFDRVIDRKNTFSSKWDNVGPRIGNPDALPMWVADMDFPAPQPVVDAVRKRAESGIYGYAFLPPEFRQATARWMKVRHGWDIGQAHVLYTTSILPILFSAVQAYTQPGDKVIVQRPVYYPFLQAVENQGREVSSNSLFLCSPHNPVGRVFTEQELRRVGEICLANHVLVISDEVHSDFVYPGHRHIPMASLSDDLAQNTITAVSTSKTFNTAGLRTAAMITHSDAIREEMEPVLANNRVMSISTFGLDAYVAAYNGGGGYVEQLLTDLAGNIAYLDSTLKADMPKIRLIQPEGTYLMWLDCRELGMDDAALDDFFTNKAAVGLDKGFWFGPEGSGFMRMNVACPRATLEEAMRRLREAYEKYVR